MKALAAVVLVGCTNYYGAQERADFGLECGMVVQAAAEIGACMGSAPTNLDVWTYAIRAEPWPCECELADSCLCSGQADYSTRVVTLTADMSALKHELIHAGWDADHSGKHWRRCQ